MKIASAPTKLLLVISLFATVTACKKQSPPIQSSGNEKGNVAKDTPTQFLAAKPTPTAEAASFDVDRIKREYSNRGYTLQYVNNDPTGDFVMASVRNCAASFTLAKGQVVKIEVRTMRFRNAMTADEELENLKVGAKEVCDAGTIINPRYDEKFGNWYWSCVSDGFQHPGYASSVTLGEYGYKYSTNGLDSIVGVSASK